MKKIKRSWLYELIFEKIWTRQRLTQILGKHLNNTVASGIAKGMQYELKSAWSSSVLNKLVGTYELELLPLFEAFDQNPPSIVFDIGAAEGFYAIGCLVRWPNAQLHAWEEQATSRTILHRHAVSNKVTERLTVHNACSVIELSNALKRFKPDLIIIDVEGFEMNLCTEEVMQHGNATTWVIECHSAEIEETLKKRFQATHHIEVIRNRGESFNDIQVKLPFLCTLLPQDRFRIVHERRIIPTPWIIARPKLKTSV